MGRRFKKRKTCRRWWICNGYEYTIDTWAKYYSGMPTDNIFDNYPSINNYLFNWTIKNVPNYSTLPYRG